MKATPWTIALQASLSMEFSRQECWSGLPGDLPDPGIKPRSPALQADSLPSQPPGKQLKALSDCKYTDNLSLAQILRTNCWPLLAESDTYFHQFQASFTYVFLQCLFCSPIPLFIIFSVYSSYIHFCSAFFCVSITFSDLNSELVYSYK